MVKYTPIPNQQIINEKPYRYAYQGQEKDPETGKEAFQLRLWDGRIGRWLSPDPYGQYNSPYLGMGNDPINGIDPDGGWKTWLGAWWFRFWNGTGGEIFKNEHGSYGLDFGTNSPRIISSTETELGYIPLVYSKSDYNTLIADTYTTWTFDDNGNGRNMGYIKQGKYDWTDKWRDEGVLYNFSNDFYVTAQTFNPFDRQLTNIDGSGIVRGSNEHLDNGVNVLMTIFPYGRSAAVGGNTVKGLGYINKMNASQFSSTFKGNLAKASPKIRGFINKQIINRVITYYNTQIAGGMFIYDRTKALNKKEDK